MGIRFLDEEPAAASVAATPKVRFLDEADYQQPVMDALGAVRDTAIAPFTLAQKLSEDPKALQEKAGPWLPAAGMAIGSAIAPGPGTAIGGGLGQIAKQVGDIAFQTDDAIPAGQNFSPRAGLEAAGQALAGGFGEVNALVKPGLPFIKGKALQVGQSAIKEPRPYLERGIQAAGQALAPVGGAIKRGVARAAEVMTGVPARSGVKLIEEPSRLLKGIGQTKKLGEAVGAAESVSEAGLPPAIRAKITTNEKSAASKIVSKLLEKKYTNPEAITPIEATAGIKSIDATMPPFTQANRKIVQEYSDLRSMLSNIQAAADPKIAAAKEAYSDAMVGGAFRHPFRQTKTGQTSAVQFLGALMTPDAGAGGALARYALKLPFFSPAVWGTGMAAGSAGVKAAGAIINSPTARQTLISRYITSRNEKGE